jgi:hypothetical protein
LPSMMAWTVTAVYLVTEAELAALLLVCTHVA